jgi:transposase-like protein
MGKLEILPKEGPMYTYYELYRNSKNPSQYRERMVRHALMNGIKPTAREFQTTPKTVRKWVQRFQEEKKPGLADRSKRPHTSPNKMIPFWSFKIESVCTTAKKHNKRITATWIKRKHEVPYSTTTILKVMKEIGFMPQKRKKYQRKRDLREIKQKLKPFEKIQVDIKYLDDIPEFYGAFLFHRLPKYQITARCVRTGALFFSYAMEKSSTNTTMFILLLAQHLAQHGVDLQEVTIQTDNGTEFTSAWNSLEPSPFTKAIEMKLQAAHVRIPPGAKTWQSDVESSHRLIEDEFYACEYFYTKIDFMKKAAEYQRWFNLQRNNSYKGSTPDQILHSTAVNISENVLVFKPVVIDTFYRRYKDTFKELALAS